MRRKMGKDLQMIICKLILMFYKSFWPLSQFFVINKVVSLRHRLVSLMLAINLNWLASYEASQFKRSFMLCC